MENRPEDTPKVVALSLAIILVFSLFVWKRVHGGDSAPTTPVQQVAAIPTAQNADPAVMNAVVPGQMRLLTNPVLEGAGESAHEAAIRADAFHPLEERKSPSQPRVQSILPVFGPFPISPLPDVATELTPGARLRLPVSYRVTLEGVLDVDQAMEAVCTVHDPRISDADLSDHTLFLHVGDLFGGRRVETIDASGIRLRGAQRWEIGQGRHVADPTVVMGAEARAELAQTKTAVVAHRASVPSETSDNLDMPDFPADTADVSQKSLANH